MSEKRNSVKKREPGPYMKALKIWNRGNNDSWCVPRKGSKGHKEVLNIMNIMKGPWVMEQRPRKRPATTSQAVSDSKRQELRDKYRSKVTPAK